MPVIYRVFNGLRVHDQSYEKKIWLDKEGKKFTLLSVQLPGVVLGCVHKNMLGGGGGAPMRN